MALESDKDAGRAELPFEPKRDNKRDKKKAQRERRSTGSESGNEASTARQDTSAPISAKSQARADEILAGNRRKAKAKSDSIKSVSSNRGARATANSGAIPEAVSRRMLRRMAVLSGAPVFLGVGIFFLAYYLQSNQIVDFPPVAVLLVTMGCFGLGVLGLTYGVLSASWDTEPGSLVGLHEFKLNFGRVMDARKASNS